MRQFLKSLFATKTAPAHKPAVPNRTRLNMDALESREVLSGNVVAYVSGGNLVVTGDGADNDIYVDQTGPSTIRVYGWNSATGRYTTTVNGQNYQDFQVSGDDLTIDMGGGNDRVDLRNVRLQSTTHSDLTIRTGEGHDTVNLSGVDVRNNIRVELGAGDDRAKLIADAGNEVRVYGQADKDVIETPSIRFAKWIIIDGGSGDDTLTGGDAREYFYGQGGNDTIRAGGGDDVIYGGDNDDVIFGGTGGDVVYGGGGNDSLFGEGGNDYLYGEDGHDNLFGGTEDDQLDGGSGSDYLFGEAGNDTLNGGKDGTTDFLYGGSGRDLFFSDLVGLLGTNVDRPQDRNIFEGDMVI